MIPEENLNIITKIKFGSHLYGTNTPESDTDYKGIYMPTMRQILLGDFPKSISFSSGDELSKNGCEDIDIEYYSLQYFIKLACDGQTVALDMLHAPTNMIEHSSRIWDNLQLQRSRFYTKTLDSFVRYARGQAAKYGVKGSRLRDAENVIKFFRVAIECALPNPAPSLSLHWNALPVGEHIHKHPADPKRTNGERLYEVCGKKINENAKFDYALKIISKYYDAYGERAKQAKENKNIDWKAISHAFRAGFQVRSIFTKGTIEYPLQEAGYLKLVKA
ncbi:MAG: nucleotidyltransferase domain-containing protein, partial [Deltaproteobacteria bacterium]|nr:nucleotidyltransferase domain-containing protein [Deltaproteobacteria bacterium]